MKGARGGETAAVISPGTLYVVATPIGNLGDLSPRARRVLDDVALVLAEDTRRTGTLLAHLGIETPLLSCHEFNEASRLGRIEDLLVAGQSVALVSDAGTPGVADPGQHVVGAVHQRGLPVVAVPGPSSVVAALSISGFRGDAFYFGGFLPRRAADRQRTLASCADRSETVILFETPHRIARTLAEGSSVFGARPTLLARELTKRHEEARVAPWCEQGRILDERRRAGQLRSLRGEYVLVVMGRAEWERREGTAGEAEVREGEVELRRRLEVLLAVGLSPRDAARAVSALFDLPRKKVYALVATLDHPSAGA